MEIYDKPFKTYEEQAKHLSNKYNLTISDNVFATRVLSTVSYYDLINGYKECMMKEEKFEDGITIEFLYMFYLFDKGFQDIIFQQIMFVENYFKTELAYALAESFGVHQDEYLDEGNYRSNHGRVEFMKVKGNIERVYKSKAGLLYEPDKFYKIPQPTRHYIQNHNHIPPWILFKNISFSNAIDLFCLLRTEQKSHIVNSIIPYAYGTNNIEYKEKAELLLRGLNLLRNFRNKTAHNLKFVTFKDWKNILSTSQLNKIILPEMLTDNDIKERRGVNDLYAVINILLYTISAKDNYMANELCRKILRHIVPTNDSVDEMTKELLFEKYATITNLPKDLINRLEMYRVFLMPAE